MSVKKGGRRKGGTPPDDFPRGTGGESDAERALDGEEKGHQNGLTSNDCRLTKIRGLTHSALR